jgi:hypothetical protein
MADPACQTCGEPCLVIDKDGKQILLCSNQACSACDPQQMLTLVKAALNLRVKAIGFAEFKRIVDTNTR